MKTVIHTNQTEKGQSGTVKLINCVNSNQKKLRIDISNNKGDNPMKIPHKTINKQDKSFLGTVVSRSDSKNKFSTRFIQINLKKKINALFVCF